MVATTVAKLKAMLGSGWMYFIALLAFLSFAYKWEEDEKEAAQAGLNEADEKRSQAALAQQQADVEKDIAAVQKDAAAQKAAPLSPDVMAKFLDKL